MKILSICFLLLASCSNKYQDLYQSLDETLAIVDEFYPEIPDVQRMRVAMLDALIKNVDPFGAYLNEDQIKFLLKLADGSQPKLGVNFTKHKEGFEIKTIFENSPAEAAGLKVGDIICEFEGKALKELSLEKFPLLIKERKPCKLLILRGSEKINKEITPGNCSTIELKWLNNVACIKFGFISNDDVNQLKNNLLKIKANPKLAALILDLRDSPGGSFPAALEIVGQFLDGSPIIEVQEKGQNFKFIASGQDQLKGFPLFVLQNKNTFSAGEIISAALKSNKRAKIIGENSGGAATAKFIFTYPNRLDGLIMPVALINDSNGKRIGKGGVEPDILIEETKIQKDKNRDVYILEALRFVPSK